MASARAAALTCPALLVAGCASGQGKTTVTAALARYHARMGGAYACSRLGRFYRPDDTRSGSGAPVYNIDCWMVGTEDSHGCCRPRRARPT